MLVDLCERADCGCWGSIFYRFLLLKFDLFFFFRAAGGGQVQFGKPNRATWTNSHHGNGRGYHVGNLWAFFYLHRDYSPSIFCCTQEIQTFPYCAYKRDRRVDVSCNVDCCWHVDPRRRFSTSHSTSTNYNDCLCCVADVAGVTIEVHVPHGVWCGVGLLNVTSPKYSVM